MQIWGSRFGLLPRQKRTKSQLFPPPQNRDFTGLIMGKKNFNFGHSGNYNRVDSQLQSYLYSTSPQFSMAPALKSGMAIMSYFSRG